MAEASVRRVVVEVDGLDQLYEAPPFDASDAHPRVVSGLDEAYAGVRSGHHKEPVALELRLPAAVLRDLDQDHLRAAIVAYCSLRATEVDHEKEALGRDGRTSLPIGALILAVGLIVSQTVRHADLPEELDAFLADGVFLVVAWVGFWYPLDTLLYGRREAGRRADAWRDLAAATITVAPFR